MSKEVYRQLLEVMERRGGRYGGMDIPEFFAMVEEMFTPAEAELNNIMPKGPFTAKDMASNLRRDEAEIKEILEGMANKGLCQAFTQQGTQYYQSARFMPGIFEFQFMPGTTTDRDKKLAKLIKAYKKAYDAADPPQASSFPTTRVITVDSRIDAGNTIHTYDQVQTYIDKYEPLAVSTCYCRHAAILRDEDIHGMPNDVCMQFGTGAVYAIERLGAKQLSKQEARAVMERAEKAGLIHMGQNVTDDLGFICNCDRWHCTPVTTALAMPKPGLFFNSGFEPRFDADLCTACEICIERCPASALTPGKKDVPELNLDRCFGCAVCATGCSSDAITMVNKPGFPTPPRNGKELKDAIMRQTA